MFDEMMHEYKKCKTSASFGGICTFFLFKGGALERGEDVFLFLDEDPEFWNQATQRRYPVNTTSDSMCYLGSAQTRVN